MIKHLSVSQVSDYERCPYAYYLKRIKKVWQRPAAWTAQGTAVHKAAEDYENSGRTLSHSEVRESFTQSYSETINRSAADTPNLEYWFASGRYRGATDIERRYGIGLEQVDKYLEYVAHSGDKPVRTSGGKLAVELLFNVTIADIPVVGVIDQAVSSNGKTVIRDLKTGRLPGDDFQLKTCAIGVEENYGIQAVEGDFWMARSGKPTMPIDLTGDYYSEVAERFSSVHQNIQNENFDPSPERNKCERCEVATSCRFLAVDL